MRRHYLILTGSATSVEVQLNRIHKKTKFEIIGFTSFSNDSIAVIIKLTGDSNEELPPISFRKDTE